MIGSKIQRLRKSRGWSQGDLGSSIGRNQSRIAKWELNSGVPTPADLMRLADAFGVDIRYLCDDKQQEPAKPDVEEPRYTEVEMLVLGLMKQLGARTVLDRIVGCGDPSAEKTSGPIAPIAVHKRPVRNGE